MRPEFDIPHELHNRAAGISLLIVDVDGVMTDGTLYLSDQGVQSKGFHSRDGLGLKLLKKNSFDVAVITARTSKTTEHRVVELGIDRLYQGVDDKFAIYQQLILETGLDATRIAYIGDDLVDLRVMCDVGLSIAVSDAHIAVRHYAHWITSLPGGRGAVRQVCDLLLYAHGLYDATIKSYMET